MRGEGADRARVDRDLHVLTRDLGHWMNEMGTTESSEPKNGKLECVSTASS